MLRGATGVLFILVIAKSVSQIAQESKTTKRNEDVILTISDDLKRQYLRQNITSDVYRYGYDVDSNGQFHHEIRGPDGITYGCYGYVDSFHRLRTTFYLSDGWGYRVVNAGKDVELFLHEHEHHVGGDKHDHHGVVTPWEKLHFPAMCAEYTHDTVPDSKISSAGTPIEKGSFIDTSSTRPPYKPALDAAKTGKPGLHDILETSHTPTGYPRNLPGISRLLSRPEQPRTFPVLETPNSPGTSVYAKQPGNLGTLGTSRILLQGKLETSGIPETFGTPETSRNLAYHEESISSKIFDTPDVSELSSYPRQHNTSGSPGRSGLSGTSGLSGILDASGTLGTLGTSRRPVMPAQLKPKQPKQPDIPETFGIPVTSAKSKLLSHSQYSGTLDATRISDTPETIGISGSLAYRKQSGSLEKSKNLGTSKTFDIPGILVIPGLPDISKISGISETEKISGSLAYPKQPNSLDISDTSNTSGLSSYYSGQSDASRTETLAGQVTSRRPAYSRQPGTAKALNISIISTTSRLPSYLEYIDTPGTPESSDIPKASLTSSRQPDIPRIFSVSSTSGLLPRQRADITSPSKTSSIPKTSDGLNYSAQTFITRAPDIPGIPGTPELLNSGQFGTLNTVGSSVYSKQPGVPRILDISDTPGLSSHQDQSGTLDTSGRPKNLVEQSGVSEISDSGRAGLSFLQEQSGTSGTPKRPGNLVYFKQSSVSGISDTPDTPRSSPHLEHPGLSDTSGIPGSQKISGQSFVPAYSEQQNISQSSFNDSGSIFGSISYREHSDAPGIPRKLETLAYSKTLLDKSAISSKHGRLGNPKRPEEFKDSGSGKVVEGVGGIDGVSRDGDVGLDGPNGPWPTGSPGPNGPWPGDPDYLFGIESTRRPPQTGSIKHQHSKTFPLDTDNYKSVNEYYFKNKTEPLYANYENIKLNFSHATNPSVPLYTKQIKPQYKIESTSSIYEKEDTYNADKINSLLQTGSTSPLLKDNVKSHKNADFVKQLPQAYNYLSRIESHRTETPSEQDSEQLSVHDRSQYQKSVFYPTHKSQFSKDRYNKLGRQESSFNIRGQYNNSDTDRKSISNAFQLDGSSTDMKKQSRPALTEGGVGLKTE